MELNKSSRLALATFVTLLKISFDGAKVSLFVVWQRIKNAQT
jgi:hypothetical protein